MTDPLDIRRIIVLAAASALLSLAVAPAHAGDGETVGLDAIAEQTVLGGLSAAGSPRLMNPSVGDVNGDGIDDLVIGAPGADPNDRAGAGSVYILFGRDGALMGDRDLRDLAQWDVRIDGALVGAQLGFRTAVGDLDGDEIADVVMTAPGGRGAVYIKRGTETWSHGVHLLSEDEAFDTAFVGTTEGGLVGATLCTADLDRDDRMDLVFSALGFDELDVVESTDLHVVPGRPDFKRRIYAIEDRVPGRALLGRRVAAGTRAVYECAIGDLDDDGNLDLAAGMPLDSVDDHPEAGTVTVVYDVMNFSGGGVDLGDPDVPYGFRINGSQTGARLGAGLAIGDFNADKRDDLAAGSPRRLVSGPNPEGAVYLFWGGLLPEGNVILAADITLRGEGGDYGSELSVVDLNGDQRDDLVVGAPKADTYHGMATGFVDVFLGGAHINDPTGTVGHDLRVVGDNPGDRFGYGSAVGDLDADGKNEWFVRSTGHALGRSQSGTIEALHYSNAASDTESGTLRKSRILGPGRGGLLSADVWQVDLDGDGSDEFLWMSPTGDEARGLVCIVESMPGELRLDREGECARRIVGPAGARISALAAADIDGDGTKEVVLGLDRARVGKVADAGAVLALRVPVGGETIEAVVPAEAGKLAAGGPLVAAWLGGAGAQGLGAWLDAADVDSDGADDLLMAADRASYDDRANAGLLLLARGGATIAGTAWVVDGKEKTGVSVRLEAPAGAGLGPKSRFVDLDGDDRLDLIASAPYATVSSEEQRGGVYLIYDVESLGSGSWSIADPDIVSWTAIGQGRGSTLHAESVADVDGDGTDDLVLVSTWEEVTAQQYGAGYLFYGTRGERRTGSVVLGDDYSADLRVIAPKGSRLTDLAIVRLEDTETPWILVTTYPYVRVTLQPQLAILDSRERRPMGVLDLAHETDRGVRYESADRGSTLELPRFLLDADENGEPELWLVAPAADATVTDQGRAVRIPWPAATATAEADE